MSAGARGLTLVELVAAVVVLGVVSAGLYRTLETTHRVARAQVEHAGLQANVRAGVLAIPAELREIGVDSTAADGRRVDLIRSHADRLAFRAMRGLGFVCAVAGGAGAGASEVRVRRPLLGGAEPSSSDSVLLFVENGPATGADDEWTRVVPSAMESSACPDGAPAIRLALAPAGAPGGLPEPVSRVEVGAPVRFYEPVEYGLYVSDGRSWLGMRPADASASWQPVLGPLAPGGGLALRYFDESGAEIPAGGDASRVRVVEVALRGLTERAASLGGGAGDAPVVGAFDVVTRVALRNGLRP